MTFELLADYLAPVVRRRMCEHFTPDCCIATARILRTVLRQFGFDAEPMPTTVRIFNAQMCKLIDSGFRVPADHRKRRDLFDLCGAWGIGIVPASARVDRVDRFGGHVVLRVGRYIVDGAIQQCDRPHRKIVMPSLFVTEPPVEFFSKCGRSVASEVNGCRVFYTRTDDYSFRTAPDWLRSGQPYNTVTRAILDDVRRAAKQGAA